MYTNCTIIWGSETVKQKVIKSCSKLIAIVWVYECDSRLTTTFGNANRVFFVNIKIDKLTKKKCWEWERNSAEKTIRKCDQTSNWWRNRLSFIFLLYFGPEKLSRARNRRLTLFSHSVCRSALLCSDQTFGFFLLFDSAFLLLFALRSSSPVLFWQLLHSA